MHTTASDGHASIEEMAATARERGYEYIAITEHSASHGFGNDVQADELLRQVERSAGSSSRASPCSPAPSRTCCWTARSTTRTRCWSSSTGSSPACTPRSDSEKEQTERMLRAMEHPLVDAIGHPTGRLIERRAAYPIDIDRVIAKAVETGTFLEINANPDRRDLNDVYAKAAGEAGVTLVIDSDAHWPRTLPTCATAWPPPAGHG